MHRKRNSTTLDKVIHAPNRLLICAILEPLKEVEFRVLREKLNVSDSVLSKHLRVLEESGYIEPKKRVENGYQRTWLALTARGRKAFKQHIRALKAIIG